VLAFKLVAGHQGTIQMAKMINTVVATLRTFITVGWRVLTEAHTADWVLYGLIPGIPSVVLGGWTWFIGQPWPIIIAITIIVFAALFLCLLGFLVYRHNRRLSAIVGAPSDGPDIGPEIDLHQFLRFVGIDPMDRLPPSSNKAHEAFGTLRQLARDGKVILKGKPGFKYRSPYMSWKPRGLIEPPYWRDAQIFSLDVLGASDVKTISTMPDEAMSGKKSDAFVYKELTIIEDDVKAYFKKDECRNWN
jgi:hypothetical protein